MQTIYMKQYASHFLFLQNFDRKDYFYHFLIEASKPCLYPPGVDSAPDSDTPYVSESDDKELESVTSLFTIIAVYLQFL